MGHEHRKARIGILGMSGNPVHYGHIALAQKARAHFELDEVWLMITPYNTTVKKEYAAFHHRFTMGRMIARASGALGDWLWVSDFEFNLPTPSGRPETVDMLRSFERAYPDWQPVWLMGGDCLPHFHRWFAWEEIFQRYPIVVFSRGDTLAQELASPAARRFAAQRVAHTAFKAVPGQWCVHETGTSTASSSHIRAQLRAGETPTDIPPEMVAYIRAHGLYGALPVQAA